MSDGTKNLVIIVLLGLLVLGGIYIYQQQGKQTEVLKIEGPAGTLKIEVESDQ